MADYFLEHGQFEKAVELLVKSKRLGDALDLCVANSVTITEQLAERMSIPKKPNGVYTGRVSSPSHYVATFIVYCLHHITQ